MKKGENLTGFNKGDSRSLYQYSNSSGSGIFETPNNDGLITNQDGEDYHFVGVVTETSYTFTPSPSYNFSGGDDDGWETARTIVETTAISFETTEQGIIGAQKLANKIGGTSSEILTGGELAEGVGKGFAALGAGLTIADGLQNGFKPHHVADLVVDATIYTISASVPVGGWIVGGLWFVGDMISEGTTGKSLTENMFDE